MQTRGPSPVFAVVFVNNRTCILGTPHPLVHSPRVRGGTTWGLALALTGGLLQMLNI